MTVDLIHRDKPCRWNYPIHPDARQVTRGQIESMWRPCFGEGLARLHRRFKQWRRG